MADYSLAFPNVKLGLMMRSKVKKGLQFGCAIDQSTPVLHWIDLWAWVAPVQMIMT